MTATLLALALTSADVPRCDLTPGAIRSAPLAEVCRIGSSRDARHVTVAMRKVVFRRYGIPWEARDGYVVDHLISLELGGSNDVENLWPQPYSGVHNARHKDRVEHRLHREICAGRLTLEQAQTLIRWNWVKAYRGYFR